MSSKPQRIAIIKMGAIGDVVNSLPFLSRLRAGHPEAQITWVIAPLAHSLVQGHVAVDEFLVLDLRRWSSFPRYLRELRSRRFDLVSDLQRLAKSGLISRLTGAPRRLGFDKHRAKELSWLFSTETIPPRARPGVTVAQYLEFAEHLGLPAGEPRWDLPLEPFVDPVGDGGGAPCSGPRIVVNAGASKAANRWETARWADLCAQLVREFDARVELTGGPEDVKVSAEVQHLAGVPLRSWAGKLSLKRTAGLLAAADVFVGCDTGPLHMAVAVGTPVVALFGAADWTRTGPFLQPDSVVCRPAPCSPCRKRECFVAGHPCMTGIEPGDVLEAVRSHMAGESLAVRAGG